MRSGFKEIDNHLPADIYLINTCTVTKRADSDSLGFIRRARRENPKGKIIVTGCLAELDADKIKKVDSGAVIIKKGVVPKIKGISSFQGHTRAFLKIQDGCNNHCSYCKVPLVRGSSRSRPLHEIIREAEKLAGNGYKEIVLCGICLGSYGQDLNPKINLADIIEELEKLKGLMRIRLSSIEAGDISEELIGVLAQSKKLCRHLHIPIQSGDDEILKKMNRKYFRGDYLDLIAKIKTRIPQIAITTDVLVGFPGENESAFQNTLDLVKEIVPLKVHIFPYSEREKTAASGLRDNLSPNIIKERAGRLKKLACASASIYKEQFLGKTMEALMETRLKDNADFWEGYTDNYIKVLVKSKVSLKNKIASLRLKKTMGDRILAEFD